MEIIESMSGINWSNISGNALTTIITALITLGIAGLVRRNRKIKNSVTRDELEESICGAKEYTDKKVNEHEEKIHKSLLASIADIKQDNVRIESKVDQLLLLMVKK